MFFTDYDSPTLGGLRAHLYTAINLAQNMFFPQAIKHTPVLEFSKAETESGTGENEAGDAPAPEPMSGTVDVNTGDTLEPERLSETVDVSASDALELEPMCEGVDVNASDTLEPTQNV
ncbi:hypothetical protein CYMTET_20795 [Cymbomonas tetramitiformis]|uniref:Uncharacterized protein n=1 Tax=Cymbomonas tetramitiformis TaxID=36881 RepID=A0AAE0G3G4_9CHLO|nr:hypothetical protein CYMTET_20795 [Cymbomonas tetramitiformis]